MKKLLTISTSIILGILCFSILGAVIVKAQSGLSVTVSPDEVYMRVAQHQTFTATVSGGTPPYHDYYWGAGTSPLGALTNAAKNGPTNSSTWTYTPRATGTYYIVVVVNDSANPQAQASAYPGAIVYVY